MNINTKLEIDEQIKNLAEEDYLKFQVMYNAKKKSSNVLFLCTIFFYMLGIPFFYMGFEYFNPLEYIFVFISWFFIYVIYIMFYLLIINIGLFIMGQGFGGVLFIVLIFIILLLIFLISYIYMILRVSKRTDDIVDGYNYKIKENILKNYY